MRKDEDRDVNHTLHPGLLVYNENRRMSELRNRLKDIRLAKGITQEALADRVGVTRQTIIAIEKAKFVPSVKLALEIASALDVAIDFLFWLEKI